MSDSSDTNKDDDPEMIKLFLIRGDNDRKISLKVPLDTKLKTLAGMYASREGYHRQTIQFWFFGEKLDPKHTVSEVELRNGSSLWVAGGRRGPGQSPMKPKLLESSLTREFSRWRKTHFRLDMVEREANEVMYQLDEEEGLDERSRSNVLNLPLPKKSE